MPRITSRPAPITHNRVGLTGGGMAYQKNKASARFRQSGTIIIGSQEMTCTIRNISKVGACILVQTTLGIPAVFQLNIPDREPQTCKVMWRDDTKLGVLFR